MTMINNALSGALAAQVALTTTSHNIANVMTPGYTRQGALLASVGPMSAGKTAAGSGVAVSSLLRFSDSYKSQQLWQAASQKGMYGAGTTYYTQLEQVLGDQSASLDTGLDGFFSALNAASTDPTSSPLRQQVITSAEALVQRFNSLNQVMLNQRQSLAVQRDATLAQVNSLSQDIASLNERIATTAALGGSTSSLVDARDNKIDELAGLVGVQVVDQADGSRSVSLSNGVPLVSGSLAATLTQESAADGSHTLKAVFAKETFSFKGETLGGQLGGMERYETDVLVPSMEVVSDLATGVADAVNTQLAVGYKPDGTAGTALFEVDTTSGGLLKVVDGIQSSDLAFSADAASPGDSGNLLELVGLVDGSVTVGVLGSVRLGDVHTQLLGRLAMQSQQNQASLDTAQTVRDQAEESWKSTSGVNQDEEAMNLVQYQQMYEANMKVIAVANQLFEATLAVMG